MTKIIILLFASSAFASVEMPPIAFPVFLREGFSTVLEFDEPPIRVVLGDTQFFQVERLEKSVIVKTRVPTAVSNMFVYFKTKPPRLFVLKASEEAEPTYYKKFESIVAAPVHPKVPARTIDSHVAKRGLRLRVLQFDRKKDFLTIEAVISADDLGNLAPDWQNVRLVSGENKIAPQKLWSERKDIQRDSQITARFIFYRPNLQKNLADSFLLLPLKNSHRPLYVSLTAPQIRRPK